MGGSLGPPFLWRKDMQQSHDVVEVRADALVMSAVNGPVLEGVETVHDKFGLAAGEGKGWLVFSRVTPGQAVFQLQELLSPHEPNPFPRASLLGVLWSRRAALEAHQCIASYQAAVGLTP